MSQVILNKLSMFVLSEDIFSLIIVYLCCYCIKNALARRKIKGKKRNPEGNLGRDGRRKQRRKKPKPELNVVKNVSNSKQHNITLIYLNPSNKIRIAATESCNRNGNTFSA
ncbi:CLUMA_CG009739, isoform A [Clunio marinus]|uniref:CLUMA_CG009739, isoform A n=1 Tax=Clunio marinus TaxID=568069 RepID=A0A1J1I7S9_9DIPT|nr:CLUMA_CG009739, isoform A [Clunio marinus]